MSIEHIPASPVDADVRHPDVVARVYDIGFRLTTIFLLGVAAFCAKTEFDRVQDGEFWKPVPIERYGEHPTSSQVKASEVAGDADLGMIALGVGAVGGAGVLEFQRRLRMFKILNHTSMSADSSAQ